MLSSIEDSHVYRMLQDNQDLPHEPRQSGSFRALQDYIESDGKQHRVFATSPEEQTNVCENNPERAACVVCFPAT